MKHAILAGSILFTLATAACGGDRSCVDLCTDAQAGDCTSIRGNCGSFCAALDTVEDPAGCEDQRGAYEACLSDRPDVCDNDCDREENALASCVASYCLSNSGTAACQTLASAY